jgi:hypothetical protein
VRDHSAIARSVALILLIGLSACKSATRPLPPPEPMTPPPDEVATDTVETTLQSGWISVEVTIPRTPAGAKPVVISPIVPDRELLDRGMAVARFHTNWEALRGFGAPAATPAPRAQPSAAAEPSPGPATQVGTWLLAAPRAGIVGRAYFQILTVDSKETVPRVIDYLSTLPQIDPSRIALTGSSTSGFMALQAMATEPRIAVAVVRVACGDYMRFLRSSSLALNDDPRWLPGGKVVLDPDYAVEIAALEPIRHADRYPPRPLLLLAGAKDRAIPYACVESTVQRFGAAYAKAGAADRFRFVSFANEGHNLDAAANAEIVPWLERWLGTAADAPAAGLAVQ